MYYTYMIRCEDNSIYTGITTDLKRRYKEHVERGSKCAKYTLKHHVKSLELAFSSEDRKLASKLEYHIKKLTKKEKEKLILNPGLLNELLGEKIETYRYMPLKKTVIF